MPSGLKSPDSLQSAPFTDFSFSQLFQDYTTFHPDIAPFFTHDFRSASSFKEAAQRTLQVQRDRDTLCNVLLDQNRRWGLQDETKDNIERLRDPESVVVVTGQQLGLFMSPLYIPYKTLTTLLLAEKLQHKLDRPVIPVSGLPAKITTLTKLPALACQERSSSIGFCTRLPKTARDPWGACC